uniref:Phosphodiesterase n=2 Tax=Strongyloides stercoralis TaxID=6248 RepID=A0AAF5DFW3_STRER
LKNSFKLLALKTCCSIFCCSSKSCSYDGPEENGNKKLSQNKTLTKKEYNQNITENFDCHPSVSSSNKSGNGRKISPIMGTPPIQDHVIIRQKAEIHECNFANGKVHYDNYSNSGHKVSTLVLTNDSFNNPENIYVDDSSTFSEKEAYLDIRKISFDLPSTKSTNIINPLRKLSYYQAMECRKLSSASCYSWKTISSIESLNDNKKCLSSSPSTYKNINNPYILNNSTSEAIYLSNQNISKTSNIKPKNINDLKCEIYHKNFLDSNYYMNAKKASIESYTDTDYLLTQREQIAEIFITNIDGDSEIEDCFNKINIEESTQDNRNFVSNIRISSAPSSQKSSITSQYDNLSNNTLFYSPEKNFKTNIYNDGIINTCKNLINNSNNSSFLTLPTISVDFENSSDSDSSIEISPSFPMQRKVSLMPALTEQDLLNSDLGYKDPLSVAKVFGENFASQITFKNDNNIDSQFNEEKKQRTICDDWIDLQFNSNSPLWPFKARDKSLPSGVPSIKLLVKKNQKINANKLTENFEKKEIHDKNFVKNTKDISIANSLNECNNQFLKTQQNSNNKPSQSNEIENNFDYQEYLIELPKIPTLPIIKQSHSSPKNVHFTKSCDLKSLSKLPNFSSEFTKNLEISSHKSFNMEKLSQNILEENLKNILSENTDMIAFQQAINKWLKEQSGVETLAFVLITQDSDVSFVTVTGTVSLKSPIICCLSESLIQFFDSKIKNKTLDSNYDFGDYYLKDLPSHDLEKFDSLLVTMLFQLYSSEVDDQVCTTKKNIEQLYERCSLLPIKGSNELVSALLVIHQKPSLRKNQISKITPHLSMVGSLLRILFNVEDQKKMAMQSEIFFSMTQNVFSSMRDMNELVRNIIREAKQLVNGEACSLFLLDRENNELVAEVFEENSKTGEYLKEIRMPIDQGIVGYVARTGQTQNVPDVNSNPYFYPKIDEKTGFVTRNILCVPIRDNTSGDLVGVAEVCNKIGAPSFTKHDEKIANTFTILCGMSISHCLLYRKLQEYHRRNHMAAEVLVQGSTMSISPEDILRLSFRKIPEPTSFHHNFNSFQFIPRSIGTGDIYVEASLSMFDELGFIEKYRIRQSTLAKFLLMVQRGYRDVPYHNWSHAFAVAHFCYLLLKLPTVKKALTDLQRLSLLVACLCHDIDHRGTTNAFQLQSKTPLAQLYSSEGSVLERHHFAQTVTILGMDECNIFNQLSRSQYQTVLGHIRQVILATDIAVHLSRADDIRKMVESGFDPQNKDHNDRFLCLLMTASDLSDQSKDFRNTKSIAENIYKEFFSQGDLEKQMGNTPNEMMDREKACVPLIQLNFMDKVALPVFYNLAQLLDELEPTYRTLQTNRRCWEILNELIQERNDSFKGLEYLKDSELETIVIEKFKKEVESKNKLSN